MRFRNCNNALWLYFDLDIIGQYQPITDTSVVVTALSSNTPNLNRNIKE